MSMFQALTELFACAAGEGIYAPAAVGFARWRRWRQNLCAAVCYCKVAPLATKFMRRWLGGHFLQGGGGPASGCGVRVNGFCKP